MRVRFSLALCLRRICSDQDNYIRRTNGLIDYLTNRGYDKPFLETQIKRASDVSSHWHTYKNKLTTRPTTQTDTTPFVIT